MAGEQHVKAGTLPKPQLNRIPLLGIISRRHTSREYAPETISPQMLSNILYAAYGVTRPESGKRSAPSAHDWQYIDVYVTDPDGACRYNAEANSLEEITRRDIRAKTGTGAFAATAPLSLVYVFDEGKMLSEIVGDEKMLFAATTAGAIVQNVYLFAAAEGWNTGVWSDIDREALHDALKLSARQRILLAQSIGPRSKLARLKGWIKKNL